MNTHEAALVLQSLKGDRIALQALADVMEEIGVDPSPLRQQKVFLLVFDPFVDELHCLIEVEPAYYQLVRDLHWHTLQSADPTVDPLFELLGGETGFKVSPTLGKIVAEGNQSLFFSGCGIEVCVFLYD
jgi:hypothetical protein